MRHHRDTKSGTFDDIFLEPVQRAHTFVWFHTDAPQRTRDLA